METQQKKRALAEPLHAKIDELARLEDDWDSYGGKAVQTQCVIWARQVVNVRPEYLAWIGPLANGGIILEWTKEYGLQGDLTMWIEPEDMPQVTMLLHKGPEKLCTMQEALGIIDNYLSTLV